MISLQLFWYKWDRNKNAFSRVITLPTRQLIQTSFCHTCLYDHLHFCRGDFMLSTCTVYTVHYGICTSLPWLKWISGQIFGPAKSLSCNLWELCQRQIWWIVVPRRTGCAWRQRGTWRAFWGRLNRPGRRRSGSSGSSSAWLSATSSRPSSTRTHSSASYRSAPVRVRDDLRSIKWLGLVNFDLDVSHIIRTSMTIPWSNIHQPKYNLGI